MANLKEQCNALVSLLGRISTAQKNKEITADQLIELDGLIKDFKGKIKCKKGKNAISKIMKQFGWTQEEPDEPQFKF